jgi:hypothetical protein
MQSTSESQPPAAPSAGGIDGNNDITIAQIKADLKAKGADLSNCMLEQSAGTVGGVLIGSFLGVRQKSLRPFVAAVTLGTAGDFGYGYYNACLQLRKDYAALKIECDRLVAGGASVAPPSTDNGGAPPAN